MLDKVHAYLGLALVLPLFVWAVTGLVFFIKPGYQQAFEQLSVAQRPYSSSVHLRPQAGWQQLRLLHSALGEHLLVQTEAGKQLHLHPQTLKRWPRPTDEQLTLLFNSATDHNRARYGELISIERIGSSFRMMTSTDVQLVLDWQALSLVQSGGDTRLIDRLYRLHYLQWSPSPKLNAGLVVLALTALLAACFVGLRMLILFHHKEPS